MSILLRKNLEPLREFLDNPNFKEIAITKPYHLNIEMISGKWITKENKKLSLTYLYGLSRLLAVNEGKKFNEEESILSATIDGKHRVNVVYGKQTNHDISITIRLKRNASFELSNFEISKDDQERLKELVKQKKNILISGGTGTGKTTLLNALTKFIPLEERIITIENAREIEIEHQNHDALTYLADDSEKIAKLLNATLRMRPDRIIIGELRNENSYLFLRAANTGHEGTLSTIHANTPKGAVDALIHNIKSTSKSSHDEQRLREEIEKNIHAVVQLKREYLNDKMIVKAYLEEFKPC
jgi:type IV secretion system protein VirB11